MVALQAELAADTPTNPMNHSKVQELCESGLPPVLRTLPRQTGSAMSTVQDKEPHPSEIAKTVHRKLNFALKLRANPTGSSI